MVKFVLVLPAMAVTFWRSRAGHIPEADGEGVMEVELVDLVVVVATSGQLNPRV